MAVNPWLTSDDLVSFVKTLISFPTSQQTFTDDDILKFANQEMFISQVPSVLLYHQEYFVQSVDVPLIANKTRYPIPDRAIGMKLRDVFYLDNNGNLYELTRINPEEKAWFQKDFNTGRQPYPYYLEGNDIVLPSTNIPNPSGSFRISFFIRPNQLVADLNAATIQNFTQNLTIDNSNIVAGDFLTVTFPLTNNINNPAANVFTATTGAPVGSQFVIGSSSTVTATNLVNLINSTTPFTATSQGAVVTLTFQVAGVMVTSTHSNGSPTLGIVVALTNGVTFDQIPANIGNNGLIDFLQTKPGHIIRAFDVLIPPGGVSGTSIQFTAGTIPLTTIIGDYICVANNAIIPFLPPDLHNVLAERTASRILAAIGDTEGLQVLNQKIGEMQQNQGMLLDQRVEGKVQKVSNKHSMLRYGKRMLINRF